MMIVDTMIQTSAQSEGNLEFSSSLGLLLVGAGSTIFPQCMSDGRSPSASVLTRGEEGRKGCRGAATGFRVAGGAAARSSAGSLVAVAAVVLLS